MYIIWGAGKALKAKELNNGCTKTLIKIKFRKRFFLKSQQASFFPFWKPNNVPLYLNVKSNHPSTIIKDLPKLINKRLSELSYSKDKFDKAKLLYKKSLQEIGHKTTISYAQIEVKSNKNRSRNIIWFNPPFSQNVKTNIGKIFLKLIKITISQTITVFTIFNQDTI